MKKHQQKIMTNVPPNDQVKKKHSNILFKRRKNEQYFVSHKTMLKLIPEEPSYLGKIQNERPCQYLLVCNMLLISDILL